jgi:hypothetical protein
MQREPRSRVEMPEWWLIPALILLVLGMPFLGLFAGALLRLLLLSLLIGGSACVVRQWVMAACPCRVDQLAEEESVCRKHLAALRSRAEQMEVTLRDLRSLSLSPGDSIRARWAEVDLEKALAGAGQEMAGERARLFSVEVTRWLGQVDPLVRGLAGFDEPAICHWLNRLQSIRGQGVEILVRFRSDAEAAAVPLGVSTLGLTEEALQELNALRADLLTRRAELLARSPVRDLPRRDPEASLRHIRTVLYEARARREVNSWLPDR